MRAIGDDRVLRRFVGDNRVLARCVGDDVVFDHRVHTQRGILTHFDGIDNTAQGVHDPSAVTWMDKAHGAIATLQDITWQDNGAVFGRNEAKVLYTGKQLSDYTIISTHRIDQFIGSHPRIWGDNPYPSLYLQSNHNYAYGFYGQGKDTVFPGRFVPPLGKLIQAALRFSGTTVELIFNGIKIDEITGVTGAIGLPAPIYLGSRSDNTRTLRGAIYEHLVYDRALSDAEMLYDFEVSQLSYGVAA